jgi:TatD DNase family protein
VFTIFNVFAQDLGNIPHNKPVSIGLHPWHIDENPMDVTATLSRYAGNPEVLAIGETGIDKLIKTDTGVQEEIFIKHIQVAEDHRKPVIIHCVKAYSDIIRLRKKFRGVPWIIHGFNSKLNIARDLVTVGIYISIGSAILKNETKLGGLKNFVPADYVLTETDESKNSVKELYNKVSLLYGMEAEEFRLKVRENFMNVFKK